MGCTATDVVTTTFGAVPCASSLTTNGINADRSLNDYGAGMTRNFAFPYPDS